MVFVFSCFRDQYLSVSDAEYPMTRCQKSSTTGVLSAEQLVLLRAARSELTGSDREQLLAAATGVNWEQAWQLACDHGTAYFLARHLQTLVASESRLELPAFLSARMADQLRQEMARTLVLLDCQLRLAHICSQAGVDAIWLKGLALSSELYGVPEARQCSDLDVLVPPAQVSRMEECLRKMGLAPWANPTPGHDFHPLARHHACWRLQTNTDWPLLVELHHRLPGPPRAQPAAADLVRRSRVLELCGQPVRVPCREDTLLILCLHAHHHQFALLRCLMDIREFILLHGQWHTGRLLKIARQARAMGRLRAALEITQEVLGLEQDAIGKAVPELNPVQRWARKKIGPQSVFQSEEDDIGEARLCLLLDCWQDVANQLIPRVWPSRDYLQARAGNPRQCANLHLVHLAHLAGKLLAQFRNQRR